jgi:hypothetical protein
MTTRIYITKGVRKWAKKHNLLEADLINSIREMEAGLISARLGGNIYKQRIAVRGRGKSGGARTIIAAHFGFRAIFLYGFEKNQRTNIKPEEEEALKVIAHDLLNLNDKEIDARVNKGSLWRIQ